MSIEIFRNVVEQVGLVIDAAGVLVVVVGIFMAGKILPGRYLRTHRY